MYYHCELYFHFNCEENMNKLTVNKSIHKHFSGNAQERRKLNVVIITLSP